jgi:hypothetical protein
MNSDRINYITLQAVQADPSNLSKTKWNKIMFFTDLAFYTCDKNNYSSMVYTGLDYIKMPYGPVVNNFNMIINEVAKINNLQIKTYFGFDANASQYIEPINNISDNTINVPDFESTVISNVINKLINLTAGKLSDFSHKLSIWKIPNMYELLNFEYANYDKYRINDDFAGTFFQLIMYG